MAQLRLVARVSVAAAVYSIDKPYDYLLPLQFEGVAKEGQRVIVPFGKGNRKTEGFIVRIEPYDAQRSLKYVSHVFDDCVVLSRQDMALALWMRQRYFCTFYEAAAAMLPPGMWNKNGETFGPLDIPAEQAMQLAGKSKVRQAIVSAIYAAGLHMTIAEIEKQSKVENPASHLRKLTELGVLAANHIFDKKVGDKLIWQIGLAMPAEQARLQAGRGKIAQRRLAVIDCVSQAGTLAEKEVCYLTGASQPLVKRLCDIGILTREKAEAYRRPKIKATAEKPDVTLDQRQQRAFDGIAALMDGKPHAALLMGVTGSGKTQVYIKLIEKALGDGKNAILLVPEIALTPQMVRMFYSHFGNMVAVVHSGLTHTQRYDEYKLIRSGKARVVVGTRTGVFAPLDNIGIIIIDEEQEYSYKSDSAPRYHARDLAKYRSVVHGSVLLLGSATPSVESFFSAKQGKYKLFTLEGRYMDTPLPQTIIDDMRQQLKDGSDGQLGSRILGELARNLENREQSILFINRRGSARMAMCVDCGHIIQCENCSVALTYHSKNGRLMCHHCGFSQELAEICPVCGGSHIKTVGSGTQSVEAELREAFPDARLLRMDADTTVGRKSHEELLDTFGLGKADILIGTQMVAKGLDFDNVTLVGVLDADLSLYQGDYHAGERTFSLLAQVVGRAGRRLRPGRAVIQTFTPKNPVIEAAARQDYDDFFTYEIEARKAQNVPPFCDLVVFTLSGMGEDAVVRAALSLTATLDKLFNAEENAALKAPILGPVPSSIARLNKRFRYMVSFRGDDGRPLRELVSKVIAAFYSSPYSRAVSIAAEINPYG